MPKEEGGAHWKLMWVKVGGDGKPILPFEVKDANPEPSGVFMAPSHAAPRTPTPASAGMPGSSSGVLHSPLRKTLDAVAVVMEKLAAKDKGEMQEPVPECSISDEALEWQAPTGEMAAGTRLAWPLAPDNSMDLGAFKDYLSTIQGHKDDTVRLHAQKVAYFLGMFNKPKKCSDIAFVASLYRSGLGQKWMGLPIMSHALQHTRVMSVAVMHYCEYLMTECSKRQYAEARRCIEVFLKEYIKPMNRRAQKERAVFDERNREHDEARLSKLPEQSLIKDACQHAMCDLHWLCEATTPELGRDRMGKFAANTILAGLIFTNSYAGRPGEWASLTRDKVAICFVSAVSKQWHGSALAALQQQWQWSMCELCLRQCCSVNAASLAV